MAQINRVRGTNDFLYADSKKLRFIENIFHVKSAIYNFEQIRTPVFEYTELFNRGIGSETDIVSKEMFTFTDRGDRSMTLRPEGTASIVRAMIENSLLNERAINKAYYIGSMYRAERPQKGRYREFNQFGIECIGSPSAYIDAEIIALNLDILTTLSQKLNCKSLSKLDLEINTVGCKKCKPIYNEELKRHLGAKKDNMCGVCQTRYEKNILRMLDCKNESCVEVLDGIPNIYDHVCEECREHFDELKNALSKMNIEYIVNPRLVRGLDYYTKTAFEIKSSNLGTQSALAGGGRYDNLVGLFNNGKNVPGVGSAMGIERLLIVLENEENATVDEITKNSLDVFVVQFKETGDRAIEVINTLRKAGLSVETDFSLRSVKAQFKTANKYNAKYSVVLGPDELAQNQCAIKNMDTGEEQKVSLEKMLDVIKTV